MTAATATSRVQDDPNVNYVRILTSIWQRLFQRTPIGIEEDFFALGGDPDLANRLFSAIAEECGRELSPLTIYQTPTIATLAAVLEAPDLPRFPPVVSLRSGCESPPILMVPGMGGTVMEFFQLLKHLDTGHAIYGFHPRGMDGIDEPFDRIEDLAQYYLEGIRALKVRGPYIFIGYSLGGLVALEMAQRLSDAGEKIALLFFLEAYPHRRYLRLGHNSRYYLRRVIWLFFRALRRYGLNLPNPYRSEADRVDGPEGGKKFARVIKRAASAAMLSWKCYRPCYYKGTINFVTRTKKEMYPTNPIAAWSPLADELIVDTVHGGHLGMVAVHFKELAAVLSKYLREIR